MLEENKLELFKKNIDDVVHDVFYQKDKNSDNKKNDDDDGENKSKKEENGNEFNETKDPQLAELTPEELLTQMTKIIDLTQKMIETEEFKKLSIEQQQLIIKQFQLIKSSRRELKEKVQEEDKLKEKARKEEIDISLAKVNIEERNSRKSPGLLDLLMPEGIRELEIKIGSKKKNPKILGNLLKKALSKNNTNFSPIITPNRQSAEEYRNVQFSAVEIIKK